jgi:O-antigen ligase
LVACYFILVSVIRNPYDLIFVMGAYIATMEVYLGKALWEYFIHGRHSYTMDVTRLIGIEHTFGGPNALAGSIVLSLPFWLLLWRRRNEITSDCSNKWKQLVNIELGSYIVVAVLCIALTNSRTGMINFCVFLILAGWGAGSIGKTTRNMVVAALIIAMMWLVLPEEQKDRVRTIWKPDINRSATASAEGRTEGLKMGMQMFRRYPVFGVGPGCFISYRVPNLDGVRLVAHNLPGQMLGETGLVGTAGFVLLVAAVFINRRRVVSLLHTSPNNTARILREVTRGCRDVVFLLFVDGLSGDALYRYNWLWVAAFCSLAVEFAAALPQDPILAAGSDTIEEGKGKKSNEDALREIYRAT